MTPIEYYIDHSILDNSYRKDGCSIYVEDIDFDLLLPFDKVKYNVVFPNGIIIVDLERTTLGNTYLAYNVYGSNTAMAAHLAMVVNSLANKESISDDVASTDVEKIIIADIHELLKKKKVYLSEGKKRIPITDSKTGKTTQKKKNVTFFSLVSYRNSNPFPRPRRKLDHRFDVGGHWRQVRGLGKDREGNYVISGKTWVKNHVRGDGEYIQKARVICRG